MPSRQALPRDRRRLHLKAGEWVEVRSRDEILATLDAGGRLDLLPFMPEMFRYCGRRLRVYKRADKTCDNIHHWSIRRMHDAVFLEDVRCDGSSHGGCAAGCLIFWKEAWLKRAAAAEEPILVPKPPACSMEAVCAASHRHGAQGKIVYSCQATELRNFTSYMKIWDPRQYFRDLLSGNLAAGVGNGSREQRVLEFILAVVTLVRSLIIALFNEVQFRRHGHSHGQCYPPIVGTLERTPTESLDLQPGELVQVRRYAEIRATLDRNNCNRGLPFNVEMLPYCGGIYRVARRAQRIIDEKTGYMLTMKSPCIILEGVICKAEFRRLCPRAIYHYWRECWLKRAAMSLPHAAGTNGACGSFAATPQGCAAPRCPNP